MYSFLALLLRSWVLFTRCSRFGQLLNRLRSRFLIRLLRVVSILLILRRGSLLFRFGQPLLKRYQPLLIDIRGQFLILWRQYGRLHLLLRQVRQQVRGHFLCPSKNSLVNLLPKYRIQIVLKPCNLLLKHSIFFNRILLLYSIPLSNLLPVTAVLGLLFLLSILFRFFIRIF